MMKNKWNWKPKIDPFPVAAYMFYKRRILYDMQSIVVPIIAILSIGWLLRFERYICVDIFEMDLTKFAMMFQFPSALSSLSLGFGIYNLITYIWTLLMWKKYKGDIFKGIDQNYLIKETGFDSKTLSQAIFIQLCYRKLGAMSLVLSLPFTINQGVTTPLFITGVILIGYFAYRKRFYQNEIKDMEDENEEN